MNRLLVAGAEQIVAFDEAPVRGEGHARIAPRSGSVVCEDGVVAATGVDASTEGGRVFDASGCTVVPGFVDCHTHLPFYGWRADEDAARLSGTRYEQLHRGEGGIYRSAGMLAEASDHDALSFAQDLAVAMLAAGTTAFECKSGYGLSVEAELRQLELARTLSSRVPQTVVATCLAAHAVPGGRSPGEWAGIAASELLPAVARRGLASAVDVYVETIAFGLEHAARLAETAEPLGLRMRIHADQLSDSQAGAFAARWGFASADHLNHTSVDAAGDLAASDSAAVLLPGATFTLRQNKKPPARALVDEGAIVALGTDLNPGTSPVLSMPFVIALACRLYGLRPLEALAAATVNAARVLGLDGHGTLRPGARADLVVLDVPSFDHVPYRPDRNPVIAVAIAAELVHVAPGAEGRVRA